MDFKQENKNSWNFLVTLLERFAKNYSQVGNRLLKKGSAHIFGPLSLKELTLHLVAYWRPQLIQTCRPIITDYEIARDDETMETATKDSTAIVKVKVIIESGIQLG